MTIRDDLGRMVDLSMKGPGLEATTSAETPTLSPVFEAGSPARALEHYREASSKAFPYVMGDVAKVALARLGEREPPEEIGIPELDAFPTPWWAQIPSPFRWSAIRRDSA